MAFISEKVTEALALCGRDRVLHNDGKPSAVAIRWVDVKVPPDEKWIHAEGDTHTEAGDKAARKFAAHVRAEGERLIAWADRIIGALK